MSTQSEILWPDGTPKSQGNAFDWRAFNAANPSAEIEKPWSKVITRESKDSRLKPKEINFYMKARTSK